jgi:NAD(P)-dependent dehydrogenase (short-subunit alcohol dehydrogenase family)
VSVDLADESVLVTGASLGIGREIAVAFAARGCRLALTYREHRDEAEEVARLCRGQGAPDVLIASLQLADDHSIQALADAVTGRYGGLDVLVHNAGIVDWREFLDQDFAGIGDQLAVNLGGVMKLTRALLPALCDTVIAMGSTATLHTSHTPPTYVATKWGLRGFMRGLAHDYPDRRFVTVHPTVTATRMNDMAGMPPRRVAEVVVRVAARELDVPSGGDVDMREHAED